MSRITDNSGQPRRIHTSSHKGENDQTRETLLAQGSQTQFLSQELSQSLDALNQTDKTNLGSGWQERRLLEKWIKKNAPNNLKKELLDALKLWNPRYSLRQGQFWDYMQRQMNLGPKSNLFKDKNLEFALKLFARLKMPILPKLLTILELRKTLREAAIGASDAFKDAVKNAVYEIDSNWGKEPLITNAIINLLTKENAFSRASAGDQAHILALLGVKSGRPLLNALKLIKNIDAFEATSPALEDVVASIKEMLEQTIVQALKTDPENMGQIVWSAFQKTAAAFLIADFGGANLTYTEKLMLVQELDLPSSQELIDCLEVGVELETLLENSANSREVNALINRGLANLKAAWKAAGENNPNDLDAFAEELEVRFIAEKEQFKTDAGNAFLEQAKLDGADISPGFIALMNTLDINPFGENFEAILEANEALKASGKLGKQLAKTLNYFKYLLNPSYISQHGSAKLDELVAKLEKKWSDWGDYFGSEAKAQTQPLFEGVLNLVKAWRSIAASN